MCLSQFTISLKIIFIIIILKVFLYSKINADDNELQNRAIGGESLDTSNFVLFIDENGSRFVEVPYQYMKQWLTNQKMWRTWSIMLIILCFIFFVTLVAFLIHSFRTSTGPFSLCARGINENMSEDKMTSSSVTAYPRTDNIPMLNPIIDPYQLSSFKTSGQL